MNIGPEAVTTYTTWMESHCKSWKETTADFRVTVSSDLKHTKFWKFACIKANTMVGFIKRNFDYKTLEGVVPLYNSLVRPYLEDAAQFWSPNYKKVIELFERVQWRATKMISSLRVQPLEEWLKRLNLFTMEKRRVRGEFWYDFFKYVEKIINNVRHSEFFDL